MTTILDEEIQFEENEKKISMNLKFGLLDEVDCLLVKNRYKEGENQPDYRIIKKVGEKLDFIQTTVQKCRR